MNVLKMLKKYHSAVKSLFNEFDKTGKSSHEKRRELFEAIRRELQIHSKAEEEIFYPAIKSRKRSGKFSNLPRKIAPSRSLKIWVIRSKNAREF